MSWYGLEACDAHTGTILYVRIGLFTDTYHPSTNGITVVIDIMKKNLELLGHEVYIVAPASSLRNRKLHERHVIRFPAIKGLFFDEQLTSVFFPPREYRKLSRLNLDAVILYTPAQIGLMGAYTAIKNGIPLISQYSTSLTDYVEKYPATMPGVIALSTALPFVLQSSPKKILKFSMNYRSKRYDDDVSWRQHFGAKILTVFHNGCDVVISVSPKITKLLNSWGTQTPIYTIPTGVDKGNISPNEVAILKKKYRITDTDVVLLSLGRVAKEKNIDLIIESMPTIRSAEPSAKLLIVGDFEYRPTLEQKVREMGLEDSVVFTGKVPFDSRWNMYALADIFCFPSLTDTQALVVNEAALMGLPIVWCDEGVNEILLDGVTGLKAKNTVQSFSKSVLKLVRDPVLRRTCGLEANRKARKFGEMRQTKKLIAVIDKLLARRP